MPFSLVMTVMTRYMPRTSASRITHGIRIGLDCIFGIVQYPGLLDKQCFVKPNIDLCHLEAVGWIQPGSALQNW